MTTPVDYAEAYNWVYGFELLSLDFVRPVYSHLGVGVPAEECLRTMLREAIAGKYAGGPPSAAPAWGDGVEVAYPAHVVPCLANLSSTLGAEAVQRLRYWIRYVHGCDDNPYARYHSFLSSWSSAVRRTGRDELLLSCDAMAVANRLPQVTGNDDIKAILEQAKLNPLSDWDRVLFDQCGLSEIPAGSDYFPYIDGICVTVSMNRFQPFFLEFCSGLGDRDRQAIEDAVAAWIEKAREQLSHPVFLDGYEGPHKDLLLLLGSKAARDLHPPCRIADLPRPV